jgi:hypothetical protein
MDEQAEPRSENRELAEMRARFEESFKNLQILQKEIEEEKIRIERKK